MIRTLAVRSILVIAIMAASILNCLTAQAAVSVCLVNGVPQSGLADGEGGTRISGTNGDDLIDCTFTLATNAPQTIRGFGGNDTIFGGGGNDRLNGDGGDDILVGDADNDVLEGGTGNDTLRGNDGNDILRGDDGNDILEGAAGNDGLTGNFGADRLDGGDGTDNLTGPPNDQVVDFIDGSFGIDVCQPGFFDILINCEG